MAGSRKDIKGILIVRGLAGLSLSLLILVFGSSANAQVYGAAGAEPDISYTFVQDIQLRSDWNGFELKAKIRESKKYLTKSSTRYYAHRIYDHYSRRISKLKVKFRGRKLDRDRISSQSLLFRNAFFSEDKVWEIYLPDNIEPGDKLELEYNVDYQHGEYLPMLRIINFGLIEHHETRIKHPEGIKIEFDMVFPMGAIDYNIDRTDPKLTVLTFDSIPSAPELPAYDLNEYRAIILIRVTGLKNILEPTTPLGMCRWYQGRITLSPSWAPDSASSLGRLLASASTDLDKVAGIYAYVRDSVRYVSIARSNHDIIPFQPQVVYTEGYGDCKDKAYLVRAIAASQGIEVDYTPVSTQAPLGFNGVHPDLYNHVICAYDSGDSTIYFDPTARWVPFGELPSSDIGKEVLRMNPDNPKGDTLDAHEPGPDIRVVLRGSILETDRLLASVKLQNAPGRYCRHLGDELNGSDLSEAVKTVLHNWVTNIKFDSITVTDVQEHEIRATALADLSRFETETTKNRYFPTNPFDIIETGILSRAEDSLPVDYPHRADYELEIRLAGGSLFERFDSLNIGQPETGNLKASLARMPATDSLVLRYEHSRFARSMTGIKKAAHMQFCRSYLDLRNRVFTLGRTEE